MGHFLNEASGHGVSPFEKLDFGIKRTAERCVNKGLHVTAKVAGAGLKVGGGILKGFFR